MPSLFEQRFYERAIIAADRAFGVQVVFKRGTDETDPFTARRNTQDYDAPGAKFGLSIVVRMRDYLLPSASIVINSQAVEPRHRDVIREVSTGDEYQILPLDGRPETEEISGEFYWLVHTKRILNA